MNPMKFLDALFGEGRPRRISASAGARPSGTQQPTWYGGRKRRFSMARVDYELARRNPPKAR